MHTERHTSTDPMTTPSKAENIAVILHQRLSLLPVFDALGKLLSRYAEAGPGDPASVRTESVPAMAEFEALREKLNAMPDEQVARLADAARAEQQSAAARLKASREAELRAKQRAEEDARFYNRPDARADFAYWCKADSWTVDEAVTLLLDRDPRVVTVAALKNELKRPTGGLGLGPPLKPSDFHRAYDDLRTLMARAEALASPRLKPAAVLAWARHTNAATIPARLEEELARIESKRADAMAGDRMAPASASQGGLARGTPTRWNEATVAELRSYKAANGTKAAAEKFNISASMVRRLLATKGGKPERQPMPANSVFNHRP